MIKHTAKIILRMTYQSYREQVPMKTDRNSLSHKYYFCCRRVKVLKVRKVSENVGFGFGFFFSPASHHTQLPSRPHSLLGM